MIENVFYAHYLNQKQKFENAKVKRYQENCPLIHRSTQVTFPTSSNYQLKNK